MIFVTVGNSTQGFRRLLEAVDILEGQGAFGDEPVLIQSGNNANFKPSYCEYGAFLSPEEFIRQINKAGTVICHAGAGTIIHVLRAGKIPVVMPRRKKYGEHVDDHQLELVDALSRLNRVIPALEPEDLPKAVAEARQRAAAGTDRSSCILGIVGKAIEELTGEIR